MTWNVEYNANGSKIREWDDGIPDTPLLDLATLANQVATWASQVQSLVGAVDQLVLDSFGA